MRAKIRILARTAYAIPPSTAHQPALPALLANLACITGRKRQGDIWTAPHLSGRLNGNCLHRTFRSRSITCKSLQHAAAALKQRLCRRVLEVQNHHSIALEQTMPVRCPAHGKSPNVSLLNAIEFSHLRLCSMFPHVVRPAIGLLRVRVTLQRRAATLGVLRTLS
ncbi:hypothetical protein PSPO01_08379 [Paraphaeosphaeria sporulosa]